MRKLVHAIITLGFLCVLALPLHAQQEAVQPAPDNVKKPLAAFLTATGWTNADKLTGSTKYWQLTEQIFLIRITDPSTCDTDNDLCLTVIGSLRNGGFAAEAVFYAGEKVQIADNPRPVGGVNSPVLFYVRFIGKKQEIIAAPAPTGWIIAPAAIN